jgi:two-component system NtrC family sensor kinase
MEIRNHHHRLSSPLVWTVLVLCALPILLTLLGIDFATPIEAIPWEEVASLDAATRGELLHGAVAGSYIHTLLEWSSVLAALFTAVLALIHYRLTGDETTPIIGLALFFAGSMDAFTPSPPTG